MTRRPERVALAVAMRAAIAAVNEVLEWVAIGSDEPCARAAREASRLLEDAIQTIFAA